MLNSETKNKHNVQYWFLFDWCIYNLLIVLLDPFMIILQELLILVNIMIFDVKILRESIQLSFSQQN